MKHRPCDQETWIVSQAKLFMLFKVWLYPFPSETRWKILNMPNFIFKKRSYTLVNFIILAMVFALLLNPLQINLRTKIFSLLKNAFTLVGWRFSESGKKEILFVCSLGPCFIEGPRGKGALLNRGALLWLNCTRNLIWHAGDIEVLCAKYEPPQAKGSVIVSWIKFGKRAIHYEVIIEAVFVVK